MLSRWVLFDGDNTLWDTEVLYDNARKEFCRYALHIIKERGDNKHKYITNNLIDRCQRHRDIQLYKTHGYSCSRFARSFEDTLTFLLPDSQPDQLKYVRSLAMNVFYTKANPVKDAEKTLEKLKTIGYSLAIVSVGEEWVQQQRLDHFYLRSVFHTCKILETKTPAKFLEFCKMYEVDVSTSWMIGDSVRSDILPAQEVGLRVIHIQSSNWSVEHEKVPDGVQSLSTISEVIPVILGG